MSLVPIGYTLYICCSNIKYLFHYRVHEYGQRKQVQVDEESHSTRIMRLNGGVCLISLPILETLSSHVPNNTMPERMK